MNVRRWIDRRTLLRGVLTLGAGVVLYRGGRPHLLRLWVESDFDDDRLVNVDGWLLSATEAKLGAGKYVW